MNPMQPLDTPEAMNFWSKTYGLDWYGPQLLRDENVHAQARDSLTFTLPALAFKVRVDHRFEPAFLNLALATCLNQIHREVHEHIHTFNPDLAPTSTSSSAQHRRAHASDH